MNLVETPQTDTSTSLTPRGSKTRQFERTLVHRGLKKKLTSINEEDFDTIQGDISASMQLKLENET